MPPEYRIGFSQKVVPLDSVRPPQNMQLFAYAEEIVCPLALSSQASEQKKRLIPRIAQAWRKETHTHSSQASPHSYTHVAEEENSAEEMLSLKHARLF